ncbi:tensin-2 isoform X3 [Nilaparvata lugens]|uniref:tensin-2 isoform X3 n=1 Tax=Nilaparvata lugens TaxID=108931 RepID=UPI00193E53DC|nr:tensin-2 isoform X3 [Nilaparvata lugens]
MLDQTNHSLSAVQYMGSTPVTGLDQTSRAEFVRSHLEQLRDCPRSKPVLLVISLAGIKVCSPDGKRVSMAHALRRISYATCEPSHCQFSFLAREPKGHFSLQYCHSFVTKNAEQAEELNSIVGNAFRMAYAAQLQRQPTFQEVIASQIHEQRLPWPKQIPGKVSTADTEMNVEVAPTSVLHHKQPPPPSSIPGLRPHPRTDSTHSTPSSEESNSPTELNSYKRLIEKPPLIKRLAMGLAGTPTADDACPLVQDPMPPAPPPPPTQPLIKHIEIDNNRLLQSSPASTEQEFKGKRISQISSGSSVSGATPTPPPPPPERTDSLTNRPEEGELRAAPWFQAGIPREITLEVLGQEPVGAFMVRESTSKPGCFALSLRVPREFQPLGIAHYLIIRTNKGYKIKGFTKEFTTLTALITHHSVMPELLPCPLSLSRYNPSFVKSDSNKDFADIDSDPDYNTLSDFRKMMADLNV